MSVTGQASVPYICRVLWFGAMFVHVIWYAPQLPRLLRRGSPGRDRVRTSLASAGWRWMLLTVAIAGGLVIALATYYLATSGTGLGHRGG